jgi:RNA polymerase sigma-70 factor (ECF subfamily)
MAYKTQDKPLNKQQIPAPGSPRETDNFGLLLLDVAQTRNKESFVQLFEHFAPRVKSFLMKGGTREDLADELAQETMLTVWNKAGAYNPAHASASTWIFTIARNKKIDALRKTGRFEVAATDPELVADEMKSSDSTMAAEEENLMAAALEKLPEEQSMLLRKSFFEDKSHADIARETGLPLGTVKSRIRLALDRLRQNKNVQELR